MSKTLISNNFDNKPKYFAVSHTKLLFFNIFYKNNKIYLIMPIYNEPENPNNIHVTINNNILPLTEKYIKDSNEPILIYIYEYINHTNSIIKVNVKLCNRMVNSYELRHIHTNFRSISYNNKEIKTNNNFLALTTLFKNDYYLFPLFYNYYKFQGVDHFYMYYNGIITEDIKKIFNKSDVTLIQWGFHYWNPPGTKYPHHAQMGQMHDALYKYGKDNYDYMIFCDLDEYLHIPNEKFIDIDNENNNAKNISRFIKNNPDIDIFGFCNYWANTIDDDIPSTNELPNKFLAVKEPTEYLERSKNIYKVSSINTIGIHQIGYNFYNEKKAITDLKMYHFYKWSSKKRNIENCIYEVDLTN